jgi:hypothetical protein
MKAGIKSTEFWLAMVVAIAGALATVYAESEWAQVAGMVAAALASAGYGFSRSQTKTAASQVIEREIEERTYTARKTIKAEVQAEVQAESGTALPSAMGFSQGDDYDGEEQA